MSKRNRDEAPSSHSRDAGSNPVHVIKAEELPPQVLEKLPGNGVNCEIEITTPNNRRVVEHHRQCPICHHGELNGVGTATSTQGRKRYYKCDRCGHTWTATVTTTVDKVEHRTVSMQTRDGAQITPRAEQ